MRSRREFIQLGSVAAAGAALGMVWPRKMWADLGPARLTPGAWAPTVRALVAPSDLAARALDAATSAGAVYADVNILLAQTEQWDFLGARYTPPSQGEVVALGVRAMCNGYWGFAATHGLPTADLAARLGADAAAEAKLAARGKPHTIDLGAIPVATGTWTMPVEIDPFTVSFEEKAYFGAAYADFVGRQSFQIAGVAGFSFGKEERIFASTEGAATSQTVYAINGNFGVLAGYDWLTEQGGGAGADFVTLTGAGWEYLRQAPLRDRVMALAEMARMARRPKPVDIGRYDIVFDANAMAQILSETLADATQLDRAMGLRANAEGTSYISDPLSMVGKFLMGSPLLTLKTDPAMRNGVATVRWDGEGVVPQATTLVREGVLTDFQTTRESASWLAPYYQAQHRPVQSNGCSGTYGSTDPVEQTIPNLVMQPAAHSATFDDLIRDTKKGLAVFGGEVNSDQQRSNGTGKGDMVRVITNGQMGAVIAPMQYNFRALDFWKNLVATGGPESARPFGIMKSRARMAGYTISAVPGKVTNVAVIDPLRKA